MIGKLIVLSGIDGTGKSTQARMLVEYLNKHGFSSVKFFEPTKETEEGMKIRELMTSNQPRPPFEEEMDLFIKDRMFNVEKRILPALKEGKNVVMDRYYTCTAAYQGARNIMDYKKILKMNEKFAVKPNTLFILTMPVKKALERINADESRESISYMEREENLNAIQSIYKKIHESNKYNSFEVHAGKSVENVHEQMLFYLGFGSYPSSE